MDLENQNEVIDVEVKDVKDSINVNTSRNDKHIFRKIIRLLSECSFILTALLYIVLSLTVKTKFGPYNLNGWGFFWILFLAIPILPQIYTAFKRKNLQFLPIGLIVLVSYLLIGLLTGKWHPFWALFFIIPVYHSLMFKINTIFFSDK